MSIESVPAVHHHIFLSVTYSLEISPSKKSGALSLESNVALGSAIRPAMKNRLSENCLKRSGRKAGRISYYPMMTFFFQSICTAVGDLKVIWIRSISWCLKAGKSKLNQLKNHRPAGHRYYTTDKKKKKFQLIPSPILETEVVDGYSSTIWKTWMS